MKRKERLPRICMSRVEFVETILLVVIRKRLSASIRIQVKHRNYVQVKAVNKLTEARG